MGDILFPGFDELNMKTVDAQLSSLLSFVGTGVLNGWEITSLRRPSNTDQNFQSIINKRKTLANASVGSELNQLYIMYGRPHVNETSIEVQSAEEIWSRMIVVSSGKGIVSLYSAETTSDAYLLLPVVNAYTEYIIWAQFGLCLVSDGLATIGYTDSSEDTFDNAVNTATYLGTVGLNKEDDNTFIASIEYTSDRKNLNHLTSALEDALNKYYYRHVHAGSPSHPSKIQLSTQKILTATVPVDYVSTPFFLTNDENGQHFTWDSGNYGIPKVYLDSVLLGETNYTLEPVNGRIYLKNSLNIGSIIQIILPLSTEVKLIASDITAQSFIVLIDSTGAIFTWDETKYDIPRVYFKGILIDSSNYTIYSSLGHIVFLPGSILVNADTLNSDLVVELTLLGYEIEGILSGSRIENINAASFSKGTLDSGRFHNLDHVGEVRFREHANLNPTNRLFDAGDHYTFYPEVLSDQLPYNTSVICIYKSASAKSTLIGTKHGLYQTTDFATIVPVSSWSPDMGIPKFVTDNVYDLTQIHFSDIYILTEEGKVYYSSDGLVSWNLLKLPRIALYANQIITPKITALIVSTNKTKGESTTTYDRVYYVGTEGYGLFRAEIHENQTDAEWQWQRVNLETYDENSTIISLTEVCTLHTVEKQDGTLINTDRSIYIGTTNGFYISSREYQPCQKIVVDGIDFENVLQVYTVRGGDGPNNIIWITDQNVSFTREAVMNVVRNNSDKSTSTSWIHPFDGYLSGALAPPAIQTKHIDAPNRFTYIHEISDSLEYWIFTNNNIYAVKNYKINNVWQTAEIVIKGWIPASQAAPMGCIELDTTNHSVIGSTRGLWKSINNGLSWYRPYTQFTYGSSATDILLPSIYNAVTGEHVVGWSADYKSQSFTFSEQQFLWMPYIYEKDYTEYYVEPWSDAADIIIYENNEPVNVEFLVIPSEGKIKFSSSRQAESIIEITILRENAFISNVGNTPHEELDRVLLVGDQPVTSLSQDLLPESQILYVKDKTAIPSNTEYLELRLGASLSQTRERINIKIDSTGTIKILKPRTSGITFTKDYTSVYIAYIGKHIGIEDQISILNSNQTYHLNSLTGVNVLQLFMSAKLGIPTLYDNCTLPTTLFLTSGDMEASGSQYTPYIGFEPSSRDANLYPRVIYRVDSPSVTGDDMRVYTDRGIWKLQDNVWGKESDLDEATSVYFAKENVGILSCGTNKGMWDYNGASWSLNPIYNQVIYDYISSSWYGGTCWVAAKDNGIAFVWQENGKTTFRSDSFNLVNEVNVYGLFKNYFIRIDKNGNQVKYDIMYLCTERGLFGVVNGSSSGTYSAFLVGRELFGSNILLQDALSSTGEKVPVKIYQIFQNGRSQEFKPIILLTNNGTYVVRNWRWVDPIAEEALNFASESHGLNGLACYCYLNTTGIAVAPDPLPVDYPSGDRTIYKIFVGTDRGVWRSFDDGYSWECCERMTDRDLVVYGLTSYLDDSNNIIILASTEDGLYTSDDDGDNWQRPGVDNASAHYTSTISSGLPFVSPDWQYGLELSQSFEITETINLTDIALYLDKQINLILTSEDENILEINIYEADGDGKPTGVPLNNSPVTMLASEITYPGFKKLALTPNVLLDLEQSNKYCVVAKETLVGANSVLLWFASSDDLYNNGEAYNALESSNNWISIENRDFYFKAYYEGSSVPVPTTNTVDFTTGEWRGCKLNNNITTQMQVAAVLIIDDSKSMLSGVDFDTTDLDDRLSQRKLKIKNLIDRIYKQTSVDTYFDIWVYGKNIRSVSNGFCNSQSEAMDCIELLYNRGTQSSLFEASSNAIGGLNYQSLIDAKYGRDYDVTDTEINWAKTYIPAVFIISDGDNSGSGVASDVAMTANSVWDIDGVPVHIFGWGPYKKQSYLRTIVDETNGVLFDIDNINTYTLANISIYNHTLTTTNEPHGLILNDEICFAFSNHNIATTANYYAIPLSDYEFQISYNIDGDAVDLNSGRENELNYNYYCKVDDWQIASRSIDHLQPNSIFVGYWNKNYDFDTLKWINSVSCNYTTQANGSCLVKIQYTKDRFNWSNWLTIPSGADVIINDLVYSMRFAINITDGWDGIITIPQVVDSLSYISVTPSTKIYMTERKENHGMVFQYLLSASASLPPTARVVWGICRGDSINFDDFEILYNGRNSVLPNRQSSIRYTTEIIKDNLNSEVVPGYVNTYKVIDNNGNTVRWSSSDIILLKMYDSIIDQNEVPYSVDVLNGWIILPIDYTFPPDVSFLVSIITPEQLVQVIGELTYTYDYRTYYATNGGWSSDTSIIVLKNGVIVRGGYWVSSDYGTVTFNRELESDDIVSLYIQHSSYYRVGVKVLNYDSNNDFVLNNVGLYFTELSNSDLINQYSNSHYPTLNGKPVINSNNGSKFSRLSLSYVFSGWQNAQENGTVIRWWKNDTTEIVNYRNRITEPLDDVGTDKEFTIGDTITVEVIPSDGTVVPVWTSPTELDIQGLNHYYSNELTITGGDIPVAWDLRILSVSNQNKYVNLSIDSTNSIFTTLSDTGVPANHGFTQYEKIGFTGTLLPTGISEGTVYYVLPDIADASKFQISAAYGNTTVVFISGASDSVRVFKYIVNVKAGEQLTADYEFYNPDDPTDLYGANSIITWYANDSTVALCIGKVTPSDIKTLKGQSIYFAITPKTETLTGLAVRSDSVIVV